MLSTKPIKNSASAANYYVDEKLNYYFEDSEKSQEYSDWHGKGAELLNLSGEVDKKIFENILHGKLPNGIQLGKIVDGEIKHRAGYDLTFNAPKSVSLAALVNEDNNLITAHKEAVKTALDYVEKMCAQARSTIQGEIKFENTQNLIFATFEQHASRKLDPHLHTHCVTMNATQKANGTWRSLASNLYENSNNVEGFWERVRHFQRHLGLIYRSELAIQVRNLGYEIEKKEQGFWEIKGVEKADLEFFSKRRQDIEKFMDERGLEGAKSAASATLKTRPNKNSADYTELLNTWKSQIQTDFSKIKTSENTKINLIKPTEAINYAIKVCAEREAAFSKAEILDIAMKNSIGEVNYKNLEKSFKDLENNGELVTHKIKTNNSKFTTQEHIKIEKFILNWAASGKNKYAEFAEKENIENYLSQTTLRENQKEAVRLILSNQDRLVNIQGAPGTGKTTLLKAASNFLEKEQISVQYLAPTHSAVKELNKEGLNAITLQKFLASPKAQTNAQLFILDESSFASNKQIRNLLNILSRNDARLVLVGDRKQNPAIEAGKPQTLLEKSGVQTVYLTDIQRQKDLNLLAAVQSAYREDFVTSFELLDKNILELANKEERIKAAVDIYFKSQNCLLMTLTNADRELLNSEVRAQKILNGDLGEKNINTKILDPVFLNAAEREKAENFKPGQILKFLTNPNLAGIKKGDYLTIFKIKSDNNLCILKDRKNNKIAWDPNSKNIIEIYTEKERELRAGDEIRHRNNLPELGLNSGDISKIISVENKNIKIQTESGDIRKLDLRNSQNLHFDYAYTSTVYSAQGKTKQNIVALAESYNVNLANQPNFIVMVSRAVENAVIITDSKDQLLKNIYKNTGEKTSALETVGEVNQSKSELVRHKNEVELEI